MAEEGALGNRLLVHIMPCGQIWVVVGLEVPTPNESSVFCVNNKMLWNSLVDIASSGEVWWVTANILRVLGLVYANVVNPQMHWER